MLPFVMWKLAIISCTVEFRAGNERKGTKIIAWFNWKWLIKWFKRSKYLVAAMLTSGLAQRLQALVRLLRSKKVKDRSFVVFWKYQGKALKFLSLLLFTSCTCNVEPNLPSRCSEGQKEVGNRNFSTGIELGEDMWRWKNQHVKSVGQRKNLSPRQDSNLSHPKHRAGWSQQYAGRVSNMNLLYGLAFHEFSVA